ncbi:hypothetical protein J6590_077260 [Homalodisca vitripennis]|nr:hypothetical protein J6590_077260 [Homalodisca vitripennis]
MPKFIAMEDAVVRCVDFSAVTEVVLRVPEAVLVLTELAMPRQKLSGPPGNNSFRLAKPTQPSRAKNYANKLLIKFLASALSKLAEAIDSGGEDSVVDDMDFQIVTDFFSCGK